jgi:hypothetical protein
MTVGGEERILSMEFSYNNYGGGLIANYTRPSISCIDKFTGERVTILKTTDTYSYAIALNNETIYTTMLGLAIYDKAGEWRLITKAKYRVSYSYYDDQFIKIAEGKILRLSIRSLNRAHHVHIINGYYYFTSYEHVYIKNNVITIGERRYALITNDNHTYLLNVNGQRITLMYISGKEHTIEGVKFKYLHYEDCPVKLIE